MPALGNWEVFDGNSWLSVKQSGTGEGRDPWLIGEELLIPTIAGVWLQSSAPVSEGNDDDNKCFWNDIDCTFTIKLDQLINNFSPRSFLTLFFFHSVSAKIADELTDSKFKTL